MATNKNQHFVPRCYLRPFTSTGAKDAISLYNVDCDIFVETAPLKNQCSSDYFYGTDPVLESALQFSEGGYATALAEILEPRYRLTEGHRELLLRFALLQYMRTEAASRRSVQMFEGMESVIGTEIPDFKPSIKDAVLTAMKVFAHDMDAISDLKLCLIRNRTQVPFVTSDDPSVLANRWYLEDSRARGLSGGVTNSGVLFFLPLTPQVVCVAYDGHAYNVSHTHGCVDVRRESDIAAYNQHQFLNCRANIYFCDWSKRQLVREAFISVATLRPSARHRINYAVFDRVEDGAKVYRSVDKSAIPEHTNAIIHTQVVFARPSIWPSQIAWRHPGATFSNGTGAGFIRPGRLHREEGGGFSRQRMNVKKGQRYLF